MIEVFKILHDYYDLDVAPKLVLNNTSFTRGNSLKLLNHTFVMIYENILFLLAL